MFLMCSILIFVCCGDFKEQVWVSECENKYSIIKDEANNYSFSGTIVYQDSIYNFNSSCQVDEFDENVFVFRLKKMKFSNQNLKFVKNTTLVHYTPEYVEGKWSENHKEIELKVYNYYAYSSFEECLLYLGNVSN